MDTEVTEVTKAEYLALAILSDRSHRIHKIVANVDPTLMICPVCEGADFKHTEGCAIAGFLKRMPPHRLTDVDREAILRIIWDGEGLANIHTDMTEDEFVNRAFKGRLGDVDIDERRLYYEFFSLEWGTLKALVDLCKKSGWEMQVSGSKEYERGYLTIRNGD